MPNGLELGPESMGKILIAGPLGVGKSTQFLTFPGKKFLYIFDPNGTGAIRGHDVTYETYLAEKLNITVSRIPKGGGQDISTIQSGTTRLKAQAYAQFEAHFMAALDSGFFDDYDTIGLDSLTTLGDIAMDDVLAREGRLHQPPEKGDYNTVKVQVGRILRALVAVCADKYLLVTGHTMYRQDEGTKKMLDHLLVSGDLQVRAPLLFDSYFRADYKVIGGKRQFTLQSVKDSYNEHLKSNIPGIADIQDVTIGNFFQPQNFGLGKLIADATRKMRTPSSSPKL